MWPFCILWALVFDYFFDVLLGQRSKPRSHIFASSRTANNTKRAILTWLPLEILHCGHTWHDYPWPWVTLTQLLYNLQVLTSRALISKIHCRLSANQKRVSWMYNNTTNLTTLKHQRIIAKPNERNKLSWEKKRKFHDRGGGVQWFGTEND